MLISDKIAEAFCQQIGQELGASNQYIAIASYFAGEDLEQLAGFFFRQSDEERAHALKFVHFVLDTGGKVKVPEVKSPPATFGSAEEAVAASLAWEEEVTRLIYGLVDLCEQERNHIALRFLDWFVNEQLEEVSTISTLLGIVRRAGENNLLYVEDYLARNDGRIPGPESVEGA